MVFSRSYDSLFAIGHQYYLQKHYSEARHVFEDLYKNSDLEKTDGFLGLFYSHTLARLGKTEEGFLILATYLDTFDGTEKEVQNKEYFEFMTPRLREWSGIFPAEPVILSDTVQFSPYSQSPNINRALNKYPKDLVKEGIQGWVVLKVRMDATGKKEILEVLESPHEALSEEAIKAILANKGTPKMIHGYAFPVTLEVSLNFTITKKKK
ncbi:MAG: TonB family protein [Bacteroidetes bacterium]|nr:TonB family protein [Bacteroidota bacterium]